MFETLVFPNEKKNDGVVDISGCLFVESVRVGKVSRVDRVRLWGAPPPFLEVGDKEYVF